MNTFTLGGMNILKLLSKRTISILLVFCLIQSLFMPVMETSTAAEEGPINLALGKKAANIKRSSHCSGCNPSLADVNAVDGNTTTFWGPTDSDVEDQNVWFQIDLGQVSEVNEVVLKNLNIPFIQSYQVLYSTTNSETSLVEVFSKDQDLTSNETAVFEPVQARYIRVSFDTIKTTVKQKILSEIEVYNRQVDPALSPLSSLSVVNDNQTVGANGLTILPGNTKSISVIGNLVNGTLVDVTEEAAFQSNAPDVVTVDETGLLTAKGEGTAAVDISVTKNNVTKTYRLWVDVFGPATDKTQINIAYKKDVTVSSFCGS